MKRLVQKLTKEQYLNNVVEFDKETRCVKNEVKILKQFDTDYWTFAKVVNRATKDVSYVLKYARDFENTYVFNKEAFEYIRRLRNIDKYMLLHEELDMLKDQFEELKAGEYYVI